VYTTDVVVEELEFAESKNSGTSQTSATTPSPAQQTDADGFYNIPDGLDQEELPFN
jgi:single-strand DNA-binding protein